MLTNLPVDDFSAAIQKLDWYAQRWKIETFHKVLKSSCKAEESKLRTAARLTNLLAVFCIIGWRVFSLTMTNRTTPNAPAEVAFTKTGIRLLDRITGDAGKKRKTVAHYLTAVAKLGGYLARGADPPPGRRRRGRRSRLCWRSG